MTKVEFAKITSRIGEAYKDPFTEGQFEEWFLQFKDEDFGVVNSAVTLMLAEYKYFPMIATLKSYVERQKEIIEYREKKEKARIEEKPEMDLDRHKRWTRYMRWTLETRQFPKSCEEAMREKERFEKEHPDWKPKEVKDKDPQHLGEILKGMG